MKNVHFSSLSFMKVLLISFTFMATTLVGQGIGGGVVYNIPTQNVGFDVRYEIPVRQFMLAPQAYVAPGIGPIQEFSLGASAHYIPFKVGKMLPYALTYIGYTGWLNHGSSPDPNAQFSNWSIEPGIGVTTRSCIRPYFEWRYSVKWGESNVRLGVIYTFNCGGYVCQTYI